MRNSAGNCARPRSSSCPLTRAGAIRRAGCSVAQQRKQNGAQGGEMPRCPALGVCPLRLEIEQMSAGVFSGWSREQRNVVIASMLGWTLDAFDYFLLVFVLKDVAHDFNVPIADVTFAILLTLAAR